MIHYIAVGSCAGAKTYTVGDSVNGRLLVAIKEEDLHYMGDPYPHYIGYALNGDRLFAVNALHASIIEWDLTATITPTQK
jgi:hypothetical protein